jgi:hypothetical protein
MILYAIWHVRAACGTCQSVPRTEQLMLRDLLADCSDDPENLPCSLSGRLNCDSNAIDRSFGISYYSRYISLRTYTALDVSYRTHPSISYVTKIAAAPILFHIPRTERYVNKTQQPTDRRIALETFRLTRLLHTSMYTKLVLPLLFV